MILLVPKSSRSDIHNQEKGSRSEMVAIVGIILTTALALGILVGRLMGTLG